MKKTHPGGEQDENEVNFTAINDIDEEEKVTRWIGVASQDSARCCCRIEKKYAETRKTIENTQPQHVRTRKKWKSYEMVDGERHFCPQVVGEYLDGRTSHDTGRLVNW